MASRFEFAPRALRDAGEVHAWILTASRSRSRADRWHRGLFKKIETLATLPHRCPIAEESDVFGEEVRQLLYGKRPGVYRILFTIRGDIIRVLTIRHGASDPIEP